MKWYHRLLIVICVIIFSPIILIGFVISSIAYLFELPKNRKAYKSSQYYKDFGLPFKMFRLYSPEYRFYNSCKKRNLKLDYVRQESDGFEYFIYDDTIFVFPDFDQIDFIDERSAWQVDYDGDWQPFEEAYQKLLSKIDAKSNDRLIKIIVERKMFPKTDLRGLDIPECIFLISTYEKAFAEDSKLELRVPVNANELYEMMLSASELCGSFVISDNGNIVWDLYDSFQVEIGVDPNDCYIEIYKKNSGKFASPITHWHPTVFEIYDEVCELGKRGNIIVIRAFLSGAAVLYMGEKEKCPYSMGQNRLFGKFYFLEPIPKFK